MSSSKDVMTEGQFRLIKKLFADKNISVERAQWLIDSGILADLLNSQPGWVDRMKHMEALGLKPPGIYVDPVISSTLQTLEDILNFFKERGNIYLDVVDSRINNKTFPIKGSTHSPVHILPFKETLQPLQVMNEMHKRHTHPSTPGSLLELMWKCGVNRFVEFSGTRYIMALAKDDSNTLLPSDAIPCLMQVSVGGRLHTQQLQLFHFRGQWPENCWFACNRIL